MFAPVSSTLEMWTGGLAGKKGETVCYFLVLSTSWLPPASAAWAGEAVSTGSCKPAEGNSQRFADTP